MLLYSVQVGAPQWREGPEPWRTAFYKEPVAGRVFLTRENLHGDRQGDLTVHGGPDKAVCVYALEHYPVWQTELGVADCGPGWFGENFTVAGQSEKTVRIGDRYRIGGALVEVSQPRGPCWKLGRRWNRLDMPKLVIASGRSGWYVRVLEEGEVEAGDSLELVAQPHPRWTIERVNRVTYTERSDARNRQERSRLAACAELSASWRERLAE